VELPPEDILGDIPTREELRAAEEAVKSIDTDVDVEIQKKSRDMLGKEEEG